MDKIQNILVGLDFTKSDTAVLKYIKAINKVLKPEKVIFVNVHSSVSVPDEIADQYPDIKEEIDNKYIEEIVNEVSPLNLLGANAKCVALEGDPLTQILNIVKEEAIDLVVLGKKNEHNHVHLAHRKLMRKTPSHVLIVPENTDVNFDRILTATDFSEYSRLALEHADLIASKTKSILCCEHIYEVPTGYYKTGKSYTEFALIMKENSEKSFAKFISKSKPKASVEPHFTLNDRSDIGETILQVAKDRNISLIVSGAKGKTGLESVLMGSVSESLIEHDHSFPLLIVKEKEHVFNFWKDFYGL